MKTPYQILGIPEQADAQTVKNAYRELARKFSGENYSAGPLDEIAQTRMKEIDQAYDAIVQARPADFQADTNYGKASGSRTGTYARDYSDLDDIRAELQAGRLDDVQILLDGIPPSKRKAEWYFLKGTVHHRRGWLEEAFNNYSKAYNMEPGNPEYRNAYNNLSASRQGAHRQRRRAKRGCTGCDICTALICADFCCECMGSDLIRCC